MSTANLSLLLRRTGLVATAMTCYGTGVYFAGQYMTKPSSDDDDHTGSSNKSNSNNCNCYTTAPDRIETFQKIAKVYDDEMSREELAMFLPLLRRSLLYFNAKGSVLEVGAGTGRNLNYYPKKYVNNVVLTDTSDQMLFQAREKIIDAKTKRENSIFSWLMKNKDPKEDQFFKLFVADAKHMTKYYQDDSFDTIVSTFTLCSFDDPVEVLQELQSICKLNGKILLLEHGRSKSWHGLSIYLDKNAERHAKNWGCVWNRDLDDILQKAGLEIESIYTWHFGTTYYIVCRPSAKVKEERRQLRMESEKHEHRSSWGDVVSFLWKRKNNNVV